MPTRAELSKRVYSVVRDSDKLFIDTADVEDWLNDAALDLVARLQLLKTEATGTTSATGTIALPADYISTVSLSVLGSAADANQTIVEFVDDLVYDSWRLSASTPYNVFARIFDDTIETHPAVVSLAYTLRYVRTPAILDSNADVSEIPVELHIRLVNYARAHAKYQEGELEEGDRYMGLYEAGLPAPVNSLDRSKPGPFNLTPQPSYWDIDPGVYDV